MKIGYARISTYRQTNALQQDALTVVGCDIIPPWTPAPVPRSGRRYAGGSRLDA